ncbi:hypothetical protein CHLNCDRAFT_145114 [Chlorella variabilis]|uniref:Uncharacterized protein n=1 Tax=Chlorella variabilis TaxID=554065 RepID=E1ZCL7_CHLVA|nr:hypothetical protein CHLNCDRAFT_145114 [Chlorella variabilis]EFN56263.1 hypothetical protein CHLNCDRAFT_145114 [Chlorella variabilis]|eukprot:XP_005848365.1 hypothetical protein CHLNCDRAFT_145114 [Chlorella variabilis]
MALHCHAVLENPAAADEPQPPRKAPVAASVEPPKAPQPQQTALAAAAWQAVLFRGNKPVGKLVTPTVEWQPLEASPAGQEEVEREQAAVGRIALHFASIVPAAGDASGDDASSGRGRSSSEPQPLCLPVDDDFAQHSYRVQVIARQGGANFAVLHAFRAEGRELTAALSVQQQWQEYQQRHQAARASAGQPTSTTNFAHSSTLAVRSGDGLERLQAIFDVAARPAWLKGLVFRFLVTETEQPETRAPVDGSSGSTATGAKGGPAAVTIAGDDMAAPERRARQEAGTLAAPKQHHLQEQQRQQQQPEAAVAPAAAQPADAGSPAAPPAGRAATSVQPAAAAPAAPAGKGGKSKGRKKAPQRAQDAAAAATAADAPSSRAASRASSSSSSAPSAAGSSAPSTAASRGKPAAAMVPQASQGAALVEAADAGVGAARKEQRSARPGRSRSSSRDRHSRAGQEAAAARRLAKQSPTPTAQQEVPAAASMLASVPERCEPSSKADAAGSITPSGTPRGAQRSSKAEQCQQPAAAPSSSSKVAKAATPVVGGAKAAAAASTPEVAAAAGGAHSSSQAAKAAAAAAAPPSQCPTETDARQPPAAEHGSSSKWLPLGEETSLSVAAGHATAVWHGAADSAECAAALCTPRPGQPGSRPQSPGDCSVCSDGSTLSSQDSWRSGVPENPSEYGLPYNFGHHPLMLFHWQDHAALPLAAPHSVPASPHRAAAEGPARCARRGGATGLALGPSRNLPPMAGAVSGFYPPPPQPQPPRAAPAYGHHRTGSTSSSGSDGAGPAPAFHPAVQQQWQGSHLSGWAEPFVPGQPFVLPHGHPPPHPPQFVPRSQPGARAQWGRQRQAADGDPCWRPHRRSSSGWLEGGPQRQQAFDGAPPPPPPSGPPPAQCFPSPPCVACGVGPAAGCSVSAPASSVSSPVVAGRGRLAGVAPTSVPPPPPLPLPALELLAPECCDDSPDLERLLQAATPQVAPPSSGAQDLRLADLWRWYEVPSTVGCEVATCGGPRGPSTAHYLPYLSSVQLFAAASDGDAAQVAAAAARAAGDAASGRAAAPAPPPQLLSYPDGLDGWPQRMRALVQWGECANMRDRVPLHCRLAELCGGQGEAHPLMATRVADLHPLSW